MITIRKRQKYIVLSVGVILSIFFLNSCNLLEKKEPTLKTLVLDNCSEYRDNWRFESIDVIQDQKTIIVTFNESLYKEMKFDKTKEIVDEIAGFLYSSKFTYKDEGYRISVEFYRKSPTKLLIKNITPQMDEISVVNNCADGVTIKKLAEWFPNAESVTIQHIYEDNFEDFKLFNHLEKIEYANGITKKEEAYILSIFPEIDLANTKIIGD